MALPPARSTAERVRHVRDRLAADVDLWVATASADGVPYLIPLSFLWHDEQVLMATGERPVTVRNLRRDGQVRLSLDGVRDVVLVDGTAELVPPGGVDGTVADAYAAHTGWDPRRDPGNVWLVGFVIRSRLRDAEAAGVGALPDYAAGGAPPYAPAVPPPGWYPDPQAHGMRWWDGRQWTAHVS